MSTEERGLLCWGGNSQGNRCRGLGLALGLRDLDLSSILSGAPGRAGEEREEEGQGGKKREANLELSGGGESALARLGIKERSGSQLTLGMVLKLCHPLR